MFLWSGVLLSGTGAVIVEMVALHDAFRGPFQFLDSKRVVFSRLLYVNSL